MLGLLRFPNCSIQNTHVRAPKALGYLLVMTPTNAPISF
jgi:hypothetical protein